MECSHDFLELDHPGFALSGSIAKPPLTTVEFCDNGDTLLSLLRGRLREMAANLDRSNRDAVRRYREAVAKVDELRERLKECP